MSETGNQNDIREYFAARGVRLWRNNVGVLPDRNGRPVRFGLGNDSEATNRLIKSSDLIGWTPTLVTPEMVGTCVPVFTTIEVKADGWTFRPGDKRAVAQKRWIDMARADGAIGGFMIDPVRGFVL